MPTPYDDRKKKKTAAEQAAAEEVRRRFGQQLPQQQNFLNAKPTAATQAARQDMTPAGRKANSVLEPLRNTEVSRWADFSKGAKMVGQAFDKAVFPNTPQALPPPNLHNMNAPTGRSMSENINEAIKGWNTGPKSDKPWLSFNNPPAPGEKTLLQKINEGPKGDKPWLSFNQPRGGRDLTAPTAAANKPSGPPQAVPTRKPENTAGMSSGDTQVRTGATSRQTGPAPGPAGPPGQLVATHGTGSKYLDDYYSGKKAEDMIHLIRGTRSTYANPQKTDVEFKSPLEAKHMVDHADTMAKFGIDTKAMTELGKTRMEAMTDEKVAQMNLQGRQATADAAVQSAMIKQGGGEQNSLDALLNQQDEFQQPSAEESNAAVAGLDKLIAGQTPQTINEDEIWEYIGSQNNPYIKQMLIDQLKRMQL